MMYRTLTWTLARHWGVIADDYADELLIEATKNLDEKDLAMKHYFFINNLFYKYIYFLNNDSFRVYYEMDAHRR